MITYIGPEGCAAPGQAARRSGRDYVLITPCRDEGRFVTRTLESVAAQTVPPAAWVIVDDGSTDQTPRILAEYAQRLGYLRVLRRADRHYRSVGPGVVSAFYEGLGAVDLDRFDYVCKMDADLDLPPRYFETLMERMEANQRIGTCSGKAYFHDPRSGTLISEMMGDETSGGMTKFYRTDCFKQVGFVRQVMWDGIDCHRCRMLGWIACSWDDPELRVIHLRPMGTSDRGWWTGRARHGAGQYFMGTGIVYMTASALYRMTRPPLVVGGLAMEWGYLRSMLTRAPRYQNPDFRRFLRRYQWECLIRGKRRATQRLEEQEAARWRAPAHVATA